MGVGRSNMCSIMADCQRHVKPKSVYPQQNSRSLRTTAPAVALTNCSGCRAVFDHDGQHHPSCAELFGAIGCGALVPGYATRQPKVGDARRTAMTVTMSLTAACAAVLVLTGC